MPRYTTKKRGTIELHAYALELIDYVARERLGIGRNAFITAATLKWAIEFMQADPEPKRKIDHKKVHECLEEIEARLAKAL